MGQQHCQLRTGKTEIVLTAAKQLLVAGKTFHVAIYAIGGNERAARLSGLRVDRIKLAVYSLAGLLAAVAGLIQTSRLDSAQPNAGFGYELDSIAAVVIGGTNVFGGSGSVLGVFLGCLLMGTINVALAVLGVASTWQLAVYGFVILLAVTVDAVIRRELRRATTGE